MEDFDFARLTYLTILLVAVGGYLIAENRKSLGKMARQFMAWGLIFIGVIVAYGLWNDITRQVLPRQSIVTESGQIIAPRHPDGHFYLTLHLNNHPIEFIVDTGASDVVLSKQDAAAIGLNLNHLVFSGTALTANGEVRTAPASVDTITLANVTDTNFRVRVNQGEMFGSLLGMTYLRRFQRIEIAGDQLVLTR